MTTPPLSLAPYLLPPDPLPPRNPATALLLGGPLAIRTTAELAEWREHMANVAELYWMRRKCREGAQADIQVRDITTEILIRGKS